MSELIAEARVLVTPDTTAFRPLLIREVTAASAGVTVAVPVTPVFTGGATGALAGNVDDIARATGQVDEQVRAAQARLDRFGTSAKNTGQALAQAGRGAGAASLSFLGLRGATLAAGGAFLTGAASIAVLGKSIQSFSQLQTSLNVFEVTADATAGQMERIGELARELGRDLTLPGVTANTAADALSQLARAGLSIDDAMAGVRGTLQLATAAAIDTEQAVLLTASALNAFRLEGAEASRVADLLAASSKESQGSIVDMGLSLQQSAAAAAQAGVSVEDTIALLTQLGRAGLRGSDAGTSLRVALLRLIAPSKQAKEALEGLNVEIRDQQGNVRPEVFAELTEQLSKFGKAQRDATLALIFGQDAFRAAAIIGREGASGLREMQEATQEVGVAAELAAARTQGLAGAAENLKNQFQAAGTGIGSLAAGPLTSFLNSMATATSGISSFIGFIGQIGDETPRAEKSISELADEFARLNQEAGGSGSRQEAVDRVRALGSAGAVAALDFAELTREAGKANAEVAEMEQSGQAPRALQNEVNRLNDELVSTQTEGVKARDVIEGFGASMSAAAGQAEGLANRIDEAFDRFASTKPPELPEQAGPVPIGPTAKLEVQAQVAAANENLRELERVREIQLDNAKKALANSRGNVAQRTALLKAEADAEANLISVRRQIAEQQAADAREAAQEAARLATERDQAFLAVQEDARGRQQRLVTLAGDTEPLTDDIRRQEQLRALIQRQIEGLKRSALDEKVKQAAIKALVLEKQATTDQIKRLRDADKEQRKEQAEQQQEELEAARIALGESILDLTGNKNPLLRAIDQATKDAIKERNAAKKGTVEFIKAQTEINNLLARRKQIIEDTQAAADGTVGGTSLVDLFKEAQEIASGAGNVGFTAQGLRDLPAQGRIAQEVNERLTIVNDPAARAQRDTTDAIGRLIASLDRLNENLSGGNATTGGVGGGMNGPGFNGRGLQWSSLTQEQRFFYQKQAKQMVDHGLVGRSGI